jgi:hypothetical protein
MPIGGDIHYTSTINFQTDPYVCPYNPDFPDFYQNFQGCIQETSANGLPCADYSPVLGVCTLCIPGYVLTNGTCLANTTCKDRQYYHFGNCFDVSPSCGSFDLFTGDCLNCSDTIKYSLVGKSCISKTVNCGPR